MPSALWRGRPPLTTTLPAGTRPDAWFDALDAACQRVAAHGADALVVSLGLDTYGADPIAGFGLQTTVEETQELLKQCGFARLYTKNRRDAIILYGILNGQDLFAVNDKLFAENEESLY